MSPDLEILIDSAYQQLLVQALLYNECDLLGAQNFLQRFFKLLLRKKSEYATAENREGGNATTLLERQLTLLFADNIPDFFPLFEDALRKEGAEAYINTLLEPERLRLDVSVAYGQLAKRQNPVLASWKQGFLENAEHRFPEYLTSRETLLPPVWLSDDTPATNDDDLNGKVTTCLGFSAITVYFRIDACVFACPGAVLDYVDKGWQVPERVVP
ncbi:MAG: hypothetical protein DHS20C10_14540 [marine bacterium B5-7]|nr:MAG: hypothetical protein DHS20C10_14540 [marine bacterium B5-7]